MFREFCALSNMRIKRQFAMSFCLGVLGAVSSHAQNAIVQPASWVWMPAPKVDSNSPALWLNGTLRVFGSSGAPMAMSGPSVYRLSLDTPPDVFPADHFPLWIEAAWRDDDGTVYGWYHHEPAGICNDRLTAPKIGAVVSEDGGKTFRDLGIILQSGAPEVCDAKNVYFAGGNGDFSVILDQERRYFYFFFTNYGGPAEEQGVAVARMLFEDRAAPIGKVQKLYRGQWSESGLGGDVTAIFRANVPWEQGVDSFWGPSLHWNTSINRYVMLLNRACCTAEWPQEGIYASFGTDLADPFSWTAPVKIMDPSELAFGPGYYPQVIGTGVGDSDTIAGQFPRLFVQGISKWVIGFDPAPTPVPHAPQE
jgi:hypothetical protein